VTMQSSGLPMDTVARLLQHSGREIQSTIQGSCMGAALPDGVTISIRCDGESDWPVGTPVAILNGTNLLAHRIVYRSRRPRLRDYVVTQGDHSVLCDAPRHRSHVLGEVVSWSDGHGWRPVGPPSAPSTGRRSLSRVSRSLVIAVMAVNVRTARALSDGSLWLKRVLTKSPGA